MTTGSIERRAFLRLVAAAGGAATLGACVPGQSGPQPTAAPPPETAGKYQLGKLEGGEVVLDASRYPKSFKEAPELAALVQQGKLPPVAERVSQDPLVIKPVQSIGKYGGVIRKALVAPSAEGTIPRFAAGPSTLLYFDYRWTKIVPNIARSFELSADGKVVTVQLRRGMKWSDGAPFTADDVLFWYQDIYLNKQIIPGKLAAMLINGKDVTIEKVDQYTVRYVSPEPNYLLPERLASPGDLGGQADQGNLGYGGYAPKHYLSRFLPKYAGQAAVDKLTSDAKLNAWPLLVKARNDWLFNPELPVLAPWKGTVGVTSGQQFTMERNPYSIWVDTEGNQLPYIGTLRHTLAENLETVALRAVGGDYDFQDRHLDVAKLPLLLENQSKGGYKLHLDPQQGGLGIVLNLAYEADPEIGEWFRTTDFRRALSLGLDRDQLNEAFFLGTGTPASAAPPETNKYFPGKEWRTKWSTLDVAQANQLLDKAGLTQKDAAGFRLRKDGKGRLRLTFLAVDRLANFPQVAEMIKQQWAKIGIELAVDTVTSALAIERINANQAQMTGNNVGTEDVFLTTGFLTPGGRGFSAIMGIPYATWQTSNGAQGKEPFPALKQVMELQQKGFAAREAERIEIGKELTRLHVDNVLTIGIVGSDLSSYGLRLAKTTLANVPERILNSGTLRTTSNALPMTFYFK